MTQLSVIFQLSDTYSIFSLSFQLLVLNVVFKISFSLQISYYLLHELPTLLNAFYYLNTLSLVFCLGGCQQDFIGVLLEVLSSFGSSTSRESNEFIGDEARG